METTRIVINIVTRDNKTKVVTRADAHGAMAQGNVRPLETLTHSIDFAELRKELHRQIDEVFDEIRDMV